ncbi:MAG: DUF418 domain-containing protein [Phycisphaerales bacterium]|nr:DUF418 domain-containing protein [Phycisphaerales bacterium]
MSESLAAEPSVSKQVPAQPVTPPQRIAAIDVARGVALLGIFCVNIHYMGEASGTYFDHVPPATADALSQGAWYFYKTLCEGKFYPLFATLFGAGLAIQFERARARAAADPSRGPRSKWAIWWAHPIRRLIALLFIGLAHALLVWFGDILVVYAVLGFAMLILVRLSVRGLAIAAGVLASVSGFFLLLGVLAIAFSAGPSNRPSPTAVNASPPSAAATSASSPDGATPSTPAPDAPAAADAAAEKPAFVIDDRPPFEQILDGFKQRTLTGPWDQPYRELETRVMRDGPFSQLFAVRALGWLMAFVFTLFGGGTVILALFCVGAIIIKTDLFHPRHGILHRRLSLIGLLLGLPIAVAAVWVKPHSESHAWAALLYGFGLTFGGPLLTMGYLFTIVRWTHAGVAASIARLFADAGRMALTTYLLCSILGTGVFYYWGLGWFGQTTSFERFGILAIIFASVVVFAHLWLRHFAFGPAEWLWRSVTYLKPQPLRTKSGGDE